MKKIILPVTLFVALLMLCNNIVSAQGYPHPGSAENTIPKEAEIHGIIEDGSNNQTIPYASVAVYKSKDSTLVTGVLSKDDGSFSVPKLPYGKYFMVVTFVGYKKHKVNDILLTSTKKIAELGAIKVNIATTVLKEVQITGNVAPVSYQIDKKVVNIAQSVTAAGATLAEALQTAPSIQTDVEGNVTLRGSSSFTVLIDGRPSPIAGSEALQQIPANLVQNVEIITNPSAKYEAEGSAGIINIVMKKQKVQGSSGVFNVSAGTGSKYSANGSLNYKISKFTFTLGGDFTDNKSPFINNMNNHSILSSSLVKDQEITGTGDLHRKGKGLNIGIDYAINDKNSLILTGSMGDRTFGRSIASFYHDTYNTAGDVYYLDSTTPEFKRNYKSLNLDYQLKLDNKGQKLSASAYYTGGPDDNVSTLTVDTTSVGRISLNKTVLNQYSAQNSNETDLRTKLDYELPVGEKGKLGAGYQGRYMNSDGEYSLLNNGIEDLSQHDKLNFKDQIQAGYVTYLNTMPIFDYQLGLRTEYEDRILNQEIQNKAYKLSRIDFFPTVHLTRQLPLKLQLQASYTRRINRPMQWNINPFVVHIDPQSIRQGNPGLLPEFTNSYELNLQKKITDASFVSVEGFMRQTDNLIQQISQFDQPTQITTNTFSNIDHDRSLGAEFMVNLQLSKWFNLNSSVSLYNYQMFGTQIASVASSTNTWNLHINPTFHLSKGTSVQINYMYNAPSIMAQGTRSGFYNSSIGIRQSLLKNKASLSLTVRNPIGNTEMNSMSQSANQTRYGSFKRESQVFMLSFSYRINNYKAKQSTRQNGDESGGNKEQDVEGGGF